MNEISQNQTGQCINFGGITLTENSAICGGACSIEEFAAAFSYIDHTGKAFNWWVGDLALNSEVILGTDQSLQMISETLGGIKIDRILVYRRISEKYPPASRVYNVPWYVYRQACGPGLDSSEQNLILLKAEAESSTSREVASHIKEIKENNGSLVVYPWSFEAAMTAFEAWTEKVWEKWPGEHQKLFYDMLINLSTELEEEGWNVDSQQNISEGTEGGSG